MKVYGIQSHIIARLFLLLVIVGGFFIQAHDASAFFQVKRGPQVPALLLNWQVVGGSETCDGYTDYPGIPAVTDGITASWQTTHSPASGAIPWNTVLAAPGDYTFTCQDTAPPFAKGTETLRVTDCDATTETWDSSAGACVLNNVKPTASISGPATLSITQGDTINFNGVDDDPDGSVVVREWRDGSCDTGTLLSNLQSFSNNTLTSAGSPHDIYYRVQDSSGAWSATPCPKVTVTVNPVAANRPTVLSSDTDASIIIGQSVNRTANAADVDGNLVNLQLAWDLPDGRTSWQNGAPYSLGATTDVGPHFNFAPTAAFGPRTVIFTPSQVGRYITWWGTQDAGGLWANPQTSDRYVTVRCEDGKYFQAGTGCVVCTGGCSGDGGTPTNPGGTLVCNNGGTPPPLCPLVPTPDLVALPPTFSPASVAQGATINFEGIIKNTGTVDTGGYVNNVFYIDHDGTSYAQVPASPVPSSGTVAGGQSTITGSWTVPAGAPTTGSYTVNYFADTTNSVGEGGGAAETNWSGNSASSFTVTNGGGPICAPATINGCTLPNGNVGDPYNNSCDLGYEGTCKYTCDGATGDWKDTGSTCVGPSITQFEVCLWDGTSVSSCGAGLTVPKNTPLAIRWNANHASECYRSSGPTDFSTGATKPTNDIDTSVKANATAGSNDTYELQCVKDGQAVSARTAVATISTSFDMPVLTVKNTAGASVTTVKLNEPITVSWNTNGPDEKSCTLTGGSLTTAMLIADGGDSTTGTIPTNITGRTTFTIICNGQPGTKTIDVVPQTWDS